MTNTDRLLAYLARVALHRAKDPEGYAMRFRRGLALQSRPFPWGLRSVVVSLRRRA